MSIELTVAGTRPILSKPKTQPKPASGFLEAVIIDLTCPTDGDFKVRIYDDGVEPPPDNIAAAFVFYGIGVSDLAKRLEDIWSDRGLRPYLSFKAGAVYSYEHLGRFQEVMQTVELLQKDFQPGNDHEKHKGGGT